MDSPSDDKLIQKADEGIKRARRVAFIKLCACLVQKPRTEEDWFCILGKLFALRLERQEEYLFCDDEKWEDSGLDEMIAGYIGQLGRVEKLALVAFLLGVTRPMNLEKIEEIAGQTK